MDTAERSASARSQHFSSAADDIMGNALEGRETTVGPSPIYLTAGTPEVLVRALHPEEAR